MIGPAAYLPTVVGLFLASNTAAGFGYGQALVALVLESGRTCWVPFMRCRESSALCSGNRSFTSLLGGSLALTPAGTYNRCHMFNGSSSAGVPEHGSRPELVAGFSSGAVIAICFHKMTGFSSAWRSF
jgi:hypothetical protein